MSWLTPELIAGVVFVVLALIFGFDSRNKRTQLGEEKQKNAQLQERVSYAEEAARRAGHPRPTLDELDRVSSRNAELER